MRDKETTDGGSEERYTGNMHFTVFQGDSYINLRNG